jgi:hypothetical protein
MNCNRSGNKWTVNEILSLQREYELLEMSIQEIALKHSRRVEAILYKLDSEGFIDNWHDARGYNNYLNKNEGEDDEDADEDYEEQDYVDESDADEDYEEQDYVDESDDDDDDEIVILTRRVGYVENTVNEIKNMVTNFLYSMNSSINVTSSLDV